MAAAGGPDPGQGVVVQHSAHDVHVHPGGLLRPLQDLALGIVVVGHVESGGMRELGQGLLKNENTETGDKEKERRH